MSDYEWWRAGRTALMKAAARGRVDAVMKILDDGIDVDDSEDIVDVFRLALSRSGRSARV
jgi:2-phospho-L-lactate guanylyltransferase (CobY/MobA/RfbA family)